MARFRYNLQSILNIEIKMETLAKQEFATAQIALDLEESRMEGLKQRRGEYEEKMERLLKGRLDFGKITENKEAVMRMDGFIEDQAINVKHAWKKVEYAREKLTDVMKERKTYEALREKAFEDFIQEENRQEHKEIDELTSYTYGQRRRVK